MSEDRSNGLHDKYLVERTDGKPIKEGAIVMEWGDRNGRKGIEAFAQAVREDGYGPLADDLENRLATYEK